MFNSRANLDYRPDIRFQPKPVTGEVPTRDIHEEMTEAAKTASTAILHDILDQAVENDRILDTLDDIINTQAEKFVLELTSPEDRPQLSEAILAFTGGETSTEIDWDTAKEAQQVYANALAIMYGFEPTELLFASLSSNGEGPKVTPIFDMDQESEYSLFQTPVPSSTHHNRTVTAIKDCSRYGSNLPSTDRFENPDGEGFIPNDVDNTIEQPFENLMEKISQITMWTLLGMLWKRLQAYLFLFLANLLKRTRLHKVPIAGRLVRKMINWLKDEAKKRMNEAMPTLFDYTQGEDESVADDENWLDTFADMGTPVHAGMQCLNSAARITKAVNNTAMDLRLTTSDEPLATKTQNQKEINPSAILLLPWADRLREVQESSKFSATLPLENIADDTVREKFEQLKTNTKNRTRYANRYLNRASQRFKSLV